MPNKFLQKIYRMIFPHCCILCKAHCKQHLDLCWQCQQDLPYVHHACSYCAKELPNNVNVCGACLRKPPPFNYTFALCYYDFPITKIITDLKFNHKLAHARVLGEIMAARLLQLRTTWPECLIPVPLSTKRLRERGFNQAVELARPIAARLHVPINFTSCRRVRHTEAQAMIPARQRYKNVRNAFVVNSNFKAKHVAIIDDVVTTGSTVAELSHVIRQAGAEIIEIWCCAKTK
jgi:ComF family protein